MSVTPNFSWPLIEPTDFVTNLPADLELLADDIDADVWAIKGTADAALPETIIDAAGDLIYGSAADTAARLAIGTAGQVLAVNSGATAPEWVTSTSGSITLISTTSLTGATVSLTSIPSSYKMLRFIIKDILHTGAGNNSIYLTVNSTANIYSFGAAASNLNAVTMSNSNIELSLGQIQPAITDNLIIGDIFEYANATTYKLAKILSVVSASSTTWAINDYRAGIRTTSAISSIELQMATGDFNGGTIELYGVN